ncbi:MAG TPA: type IV pilus secretin PilQ [Vitreimonas sp.]|nr:type IV pilus secretin PilQ [Vitreimonas sp.]
MNIKALLSALLFFSVLNFAYAEEQSGLANKIEKVDFATLSGGRVAIKIRTAQPIQNTPPSFTLNNPSRIAFDFPDTANGLNKTNLPVEQGPLKSISVAQAKERTRMVLNLSKAVAYDTSMSGNETTIVLQSDAISTKAANETITRFAEVTTEDQTHTVTNVDFMRGKNGEGRIMVDLSDKAAGIDIKQQGKKIVVDFINTNLPANLQRRLNVVNFNTPVLYVDTLKQGNNTRMIIEPQGNWEQSAYQTDNRFIVDVRPVVEDPNKLVQGSKKGYAGEKLSLNFQNIDVRSVLQVIADFTGFNIITSDTVTGNLTLRLKDVPWDQALDIIMQAKGLSMRKTGNVIWVAPSEEVAAKEKLLLESSQQIEDLEPMRTEVYALRYQKADAVKNLISDAKQKILSKRGSAVVDVRTNTLFVQDTTKHLEEVQNIINKIDIPVRQVMIESRLVIADERFGRSLGARFGVTQRGTPGETVSTIGGTIGNRFTQQTDDTITMGNHVGTQMTSTGSRDIMRLSPDGEPDLNVNLPVAGSFGNFAFTLFRLPAGFLLNLELSALETDQRGKVVSSPRVTTANQQKAIIEQGTEIPYQQATSSGATSVAFKKASLSLEVTPQITPDEKIIMDLEVKKDRVGQVFVGIPSIDTQRVQTQVLVANGETAVLGGIYEQTERNDVDKVPFFGDLPFVGNVFKRRVKQNDKTELLIFITPRVMDENLAIR